jgi:hypothetical protein
MLVPWFIITRLYITISTIDREVSSNLFLLICEEEEKKRLVVSMADHAKT